MRYILAGPLTADGILKILQHRAKHAGISTHITPHVMRATYITLALHAGAPLHKVQYATGSRSAHDRAPSSLQAQPR